MFGSSVVVLQESEWFVKCTESNSLAAPKRGGAGLLAAAGLVKTFRSITIIVLITGKTNAICGGTRKMFKKRLRVFAGVGVENSWRPTQVLRMRWLKQLFFENVFARTRVVGTSGQQHKVDSNSHQRNGLAFARKRSAG